MGNLLKSSCLGLSFFLLACGCWLLASACEPQRPQEQSAESSPSRSDAAETTQPDTATPTDSAPQERATPEPAPDLSPPPPDRRTAPDVPPPADRSAPPDKPATSWVHPAQPIQGKATWYNADGTGNCSLPKASSPPMVAAMNEQQYGAADFCGACARVKGPNGTVVVTITDRCPECASGHLDLSKEAFATIADPKTGVIAISWQIIPCDQTAPMQYFYKDGSSQWWTAIQVRRHRLPITKLEAFKGGKWVQLKRERYNFFVDSGGLGDKPVKLRVHALDGQTREDTIPAPSSSKLHTGTQQF